MEFEALRNNVIIECQKAEEKLISRFHIVSLVNYLFCGRLWYNTYGLH